jgi:hypothetical protein
MSCFNPSFPSRSLNALSSQTPPTPHLPNPTNPIPDAAAAQRRTRSTGPSPPSALSLPWPLQTAPHPRGHLWRAYSCLLACFASDLHVSPLAKRVRDPACGSPVGRAGRSVRREESRPRRADSLRFCGTRARRGLGCIGGNVEHLKTAVWRRRSGQASFW